MKQFLPCNGGRPRGCELVSSRNFPDETQGDYLLNNVIGFQGVLRYRDEGGWIGICAVRRSSPPEVRRTPTSARSTSSSVRTGPCIWSTGTTP